MKSNKITDIVREQKKAHKNSTEDRFAPRPYGPLFMEAFIAREDFARGDKVSRKGREEEKNRCVDCKHHIPSPLERWDKQGRSVGGCSVAPPNDTYYDTIFWTCPAFEEK